MNRLMKHWDSTAPKTSLPPTDHHLVNFPFNIDQQSKRRKPRWDRKLDDAEYVLFACGPDAADQENFENCEEKFNESETVFIPM